MRIGQFAGLDTSSQDKFKRKFDAFVKGEAAEAEVLFWNEKKPVHCLSTRFEGVNYRVSMLIGTASELSEGYIATYNPNVYNQFTTWVDDETEEQRKRRTDGRWLLSFVKALEHTKRTKGCLIQVRAAHTDTRTVCAGLLLKDPARGFTLACLLAVAAAADRPRGQAAVQRHAGGGEEDGRRDGHQGARVRVQGERGQRDDTPLPDRDETPLQGY